VIDGSFQILNERAAAPHVERLRTVANGEDGLAMIECVLQEQLVSHGAGGDRSDAVSGAAVSP
jgi:hypothetical protein